jgi:hypothetical protein
VATDWSTFGQDNTPKDNAPSGLTTDWSNFNGVKAGNQNPNRLPAWQTGGNPNSEKSGFSNEFYDQMRKQRDAEQAKIDADPTYQSRLFQNKDFTGIVTWDQQFKDGDPDKRNFKTGDVYENGKFQYNLYDHNSNVTTEEANAILTPLVTGKDAGRIYRDADGNQDAIKEQTLQQGTKEGKTVEAGLTSRETEERVSKLKADWKKSGFDAPIAIAAQTGMGALQGAAFGPWGAVGGSIAGFVGGLLNRDEVIDLAARATDQTSQGFKQNAAVGIGGAAQAFGGLAMNSGTLRAIEHGIYDAALPGGIGDGQSAYYQTQNKGLGADVLDGVLQFGDSALLSASAPGRVAYTASMGAAATGKALSLTGGKVWSDYSQSWVTPDNVLAAAASAGIDAAQMFVPSILFRSAKAAIGAERAATSEVTQAGGRTFTRIQDDAGNWAVQERSLGRKIADAVPAFLAPSTMIEWVGLRGAALAANKTGAKITSQDLFNAAERIHHAPAMYQVITNGWHEAVEEVAQTVLDNVAVGYSDTNGMRDQIVQAALMGFAGGAGQTAGTHFAARVARNQNNDQRDLDRINARNFVNGEPEITMKDLKAMNPAARADATTLKTHETRIMGEGMRRIARDWQRDQAYTNAFLEQAYDASSDLEARIKLQGDGVENMRALAPISDIRKGLEDAGYQSWESTSHMLSDKIQQLQDVIKAGQKDLQQSENAEDIQANLEYAQKALAFHMRTKQIFDDLHELYLTGDLSAVDSINGLFNSIANGYMPDDNGNLPPQSDEFTRTEGIFMVSRYPNDNPGSFVPIVPQVSHSLSQGMDNGYGDILSGNGVLQLSQSVFDALSADTDGDQAKLQLRAAPINRIAAQRIKDGSFLKKPDGTYNVPDRKYEMDARQLVQESLTSPDDEHNAIANNFLMGLEMSLKKIFATVGIPNEVVEQAVGKSRVDKATQLRVRVKDSNGNDMVGEYGSGNEDWKANLYKTLASLYPDNMERLSMLRTEVQIPQGDAEPITRVYENRSSILLIEGLIQAHQQDFRMKNAQRVTTQLLHENGALPSTPEAVAGRVSTEAAQAGSTLGISLHQATYGSDTFRNETRLAYNSYNNEDFVSGNYENPNPMMQELIRIYTAINSGRQTSKIDQLVKNADPIVAQARKDVEALAKVLYPDVPLQFVLPNLAAMTVAEATEYDVNNQIPFWETRRGERNTVSVLQLIMRSAADMEARNSGLDESEQSKRIQYYRNLSPEGASNALVAAMPVEAIVGDELAAKHNLTGKSMAMINARYMGLGADARSALRTRWRRDPASATTFDGKPVKNGFPYESGTVMTPWTFFVDTVTGNVDTQLTHGENGRPLGELATLNRAEHEDMLRAMQGVRDILDRVSRQFRGKPLNLARLRKEGPAHLATELSTNTELIKQVLKLFPKTLQAFLPADPNGEINVATVPRWVYEMLLAQPEEAAMIMFRNVLIHKFQMDNQTLENAISDPTDPWVLAMRKIQALGRIDEFLDRIADAKDLMDFEAWVNKTFRKDDVPLLAYTSDTFLSDLSATRGGWQWISSNTERREAMRNLQQYVNLAGGRIKTIADNEADDLAYDQQIRQNPSIKKLVKTRIEQALLFQNPTVAGDTQQLAVLTLVEGIDNNAAKKGESGFGTKGLGDTEALFQGRLFASVHELATMERFSIYVDELTANPRRLLQPLRIQMDDGSTFDWNPTDANGEVDVEGWLDMYKAKNGFFKPLFQQIFWPSSYSTDGEGQTRMVTQKAGRGLQEWVDGSHYRRLQESDSFWDSHEYVRLVQSLHGDYLVTELLTALMTLRSGQSAEAHAKHENSYENAVVDLARALKTVGNLTPDNVKMYKDLARTTALKTKAGELDPLMPSIARVIDEEQQKILLAKQNAKSPEELAALQLQEYILHAQAQAQTAAEYTLASTKFDWANADQVTLMKANLTQYLNRYADDLTSMSDNKESQAITQWKRNPDSLKEGDWDLISTAIATNLEVQPSRRSPDTVNNGSYFSTDAYQFFMRGDRSYLTDMLYDLAASASKFRATAYGVETPATPVDDVPKALGDILHLDDMPPHSPDYVIQHISAREKIRSAAGMHEIDALGSGFKRLETQMSSNRRTFKRPTLDMARKMVLTDEEALDIVNLAAAGYPVGGVDLNILQGATVHSTGDRNAVDLLDPYSEANDNVGIMVNMTLADGRKVSLPIQRLSNGIDPTVSVDLEDKSDVTDPTYRTFDVDRFAAAYQTINIPEGGKIDSVELSYFHPLDTPIGEEYANNLAFGGRIGVADSDYGDSLTQAFYFGVQSANQQGTRAVFDSRKNATSAIQKLGIVSPAGTDYAGNLEAFIQDEVRGFMAIERDGQPLDRYNYRYAYKTVVDHMMLTDEAGKSYTPYQILQGAQPEGNLQVTWLSETVLNTLRGGFDRFAQAALRPVGATYVNNQDPWTGQYSDDMLALVPKLGNVDISTPKGRKQFLQQLSASRLASTARVSNNLSKSIESITMRRKAIEVKNRFRKEKDEVRVDRIGNKQNIWLDINSQTLKKLSEFKATTFNLGFLTSTLTKIQKVPTEGSPDFERFMSKKQIEVLTDRLLSENAVLWWYDTNTSPAEGRDKGVLTKDTWSANSQQAVAPDLDFFAVDLSGLDRDIYGKDFQNRAKSILSDLAKRHHPIILASRDQNQVAEGKKILQSLGYYSQDGTTWEPIDNASLYANERARDAAWTYVENLDADDSHLMAYGSYTLDESGAYYDERAGLIGGTAYRNSAIATTGSTIFGTPMTHAWGNEAQTVLSQLDNMTGYAYLAEQSMLAADPELEVGQINRNSREFKLLVDTWRGRVRKAVDTLDTANGLPRKSHRTFNVGDIILTQGDNGRYRIVIAGFEPVDDVNAVSQLKRNPGGDNLPNIAVYQEKQLSTSVASTPIGTIEDWEPDPRFGLRGKFRQPMGVVANKFINITGYKARAVEVTETPLGVSSKPVLGQRHIAMYLSYRDAAKKGMLDKVQNAPGNAIAFWGFNFIPLLAEGTTATYTGGRITDASQYETLTDVQKQEVRESVIRSLRAIQQEGANDPIYVGAELADAVVHGIEKNAYLTPALAREQEMQISYPVGYKTGFTAESLAQVTASKVYLEAVTAMLKHPGTRIEDLINVPGISNIGVGNGFSFRPSPALSQAFSYDVLRTWIQRDINARLRDTSNTYDEATGELLDGYELQPSWEVKRVAQKNGKRQEHLEMYQWAHMSPTGSDYTALVEHHELTNADDRSSFQVASFGTHSAMLKTGYNVPSKRLEQIRQAAMVGSLDTAEGVAATFDTKPAWSRDRQLQTRLRSPREQIARAKATRWYRASQPRLDQRNWSDPTLYNDTVERIVNAWGLSPVGDYRYLVDQLVRQRLAALSEKDETGARSGEVFQADAEFEADQILSRIEAGEWPTEGGVLFIPDPEMVQELLAHGGKLPEGVTNMEEAFNHVMGDIILNGTQLSYQEFLPALDGFVHAWEDYFDMDIVSLDPAVRDRFIDPRDGGLYTTLDPLTQEQLEINPTDGNGRQSGMYYYGGSWNTGLKDGEYPAYIGVGKKMTYLDKRRIKKESKAKQTISQQVNEGRKMGAAITFSNRAFRVWHRWVAAVGMANPEIIIWGGAEAIRNGAQEKTLRLLTGSTVWQQQIAARTHNALTELWPSFLQSTYGQALLPGVTPFVSQEDLKLRQDVIEALAGSQEWRTQINAESKHKVIDPSAGKPEEALDKVLDVLGRMQDPTSRMYMRGKAAMYIDTILRHMHATNHPTTPRELLLMLRNNRGMLKEQAPDLHDVGSRAIQRQKGFDRTVPAAITDGLLGAARNSANPLINWSGNILKGLSVFQNFFWTTGMVTTGTQGLNAIAATLLQGSRGGKTFGNRVFNGIARNNGLENAIDLQEQVMGQTALAEAMLRGSVTQMHLFMLGLIFGSLGLTGEDEEERKRRKRNLNQGLGAWYDPEDLANDFRNYNAIYLDNIPLLGELFQAPNAEGQPERSPAQLHWTLKLFLSPAMGMADFFDTGNVAYLLEGFKDAVGSLPFSSILSVQDTANTVTALAQAAAQGADKAATPGEYADALNPLLTGALLMEKVTLENNFITSLYVNTDEYNRNPWVYGAVDESGNIVTDKLGVPQSSEAYQYKTNADGTVYEGKVYRTPEEGALRAAISERPTLATMLNIAFSTSGTINSYWRQDMVPSEVVQYKKALGFDQAEPLILSVWDPNNNREVLTRDGADRILQSLGMGSVKATDPALDGVYIDVPTRQAIMVDLQKRIYIEGRETLGLTDEEAKARVSKIWYGDKSNPYVTPLNDVVWNQGEFAGDNGLPYAQTTRYRQLNTTFATGPDGKAWATGLQRGSLYQWVGLDPYQGTQAVESQTFGLNQDGNLNATDPITQQNIGRRALQKIGSNWDIPNDADIVDAIKAAQTAITDQLKDLQAADYASYAKRGGYAFGPGGGGGGGSRYGNESLMPFLNGMNVPFADNMPNIFINNVIPRRADIRRERFSSDRGRLNNQQ